MKRLTARRVNGIKEGYWSTVKKDDLVQRLGRYEDTGLEPEEISKIARTGISAGERLPKPSHSEENLGKENTSMRLKKIMRERNLRQVDILELCKPYCQKYNIKLGRNDLSQYVTGKVEPGPKKLTILSLALNISEAWLLGYNVPMELNAYEDQNILSLRRK